MRKSRPSRALLLIATVLAPRHLWAQAAITAGRAADPNAAIRVSSLTGSLRITTWPRDSITVRGRVDAGTGRFYLGGVPTALKLGIEPPDSGEPQGVADLDIVVPEGSRLWVKSSAAEIDITAGGGSVEVTNVSGQVRVAGQASSVSVETLDGNVELAARSALGHVRTASGTIVVRGVVNDLDASTVSGRLYIGMEGAVDRVRLETVSSEIAFKGDLTREGRLEAETHGGDVELRLPVRLQAAYHLLSYGGGVVNQLVPPSVVRRGQGKGEWSFQTGDGRATVMVRTFKGTITLKVRGEPPGN
ncbi:MAG TPA: DUF4097 family beta strand repeat-containing protein [Gemmatimonadales bacterium]|nr:DUF4097 family beta strand repeat-containing protein [Gemmatimonadales bacterium]